MYQHAPPPRDQAPPPRLFSNKLLLKNANGALASLAGQRGFRKYVVAQAAEIGITGTIQRFHHSDIVVNIEGNNQQIDQFFEFLHDCIGQGMIEYIERRDDEREIRRLTMRDFSIVTDHSRTVDKGGKVIKCPYSDNDHDKESVSSAGSAILLV
mmetsp:Transcript_19707/g.33168  ORF Transcript_19707/g.33168 Transcript_19707/m.33168 type:complete len:154 (+) Transcript_19707:426-887(+)